MIDGSFPKSVAELRAELDRLRGELKRLDAAGNRRGALKILGQMIATQKAFMERWPLRAEAHQGNGNGSAFSADAPVSDAGGKG